MISTLTESLFVFPVAHGIPLTEVTVASIELVKDSTSALNSVDQLTVKVCSLFDETDTEPGYATFNPISSTVILTSSLKDVMVLSELTIPAVALQSEMMIPHPKVIALLKRKFESVEVLYDNDFNKENNPGQTMAMKICAKYDLKNIVIPEHYGEKDPSDLRKIHGKEALIKLLK